MAPTTKNTGKAWIQALIKKSWEISWDMWDHRNQVRLNMVTPAMCREAKILNEHIIQQFEEGQVRLRPQDYHFLSKPLAMFLGTTQKPKLSGWNLWNWPNPVS
jgi:hypothetical protein